MAGRKLKTMSPSTGDENFQKKLLQDFKSFCSNEDNRLVTFWNNSWEAKEKSQVK